MSRTPVEAKDDHSTEDYVAGWDATLRLVQEGRSWSGRERNCAFLNTGGARFANVSAATGVDFADDGRALGVVDWDHDGDLDLWIGNRSGPRLRLLINQTDPADGKHAYVALRLRGTSSNRDGIGARVEVRLRPPTAGKLVQTLAAGDGYISQSSKWLHFGLGADPKIEQVTVNWPGGRAETFSGVVAGRRYLLVEGRGRAEQWQRPAREAIELKPAPQVRPPLSQTARIILPVRIPMPKLRYRSFDDPTSRTVKTSGKPLLLNLWASWCLPCVAELKEFDSNADELRAAGLNVLTLSVDGLGQEIKSQPADAKHLLDRLNFPFDAGVATIELLDKLALVEEWLFDRFTPFAVPASLLLDGEGDLAVIYRGRIGVETLLRDVENLKATGERRVAMGAPLGGQWYSKLVGIELESFAQKFQERYAEDSLRYLELALEQSVARGKPESKNQASAHTSIGHALLSENKFEEAIDHFREAIRLEPELADAHYYLAVALHTQGKLEAAAAEYRETLRLDPGDGDAHTNYGRVLEAQGKIDEAIRQYQLRLDADPDAVATRFSLAKTLKSQGRFDEAIGHCRRVLRAQPEHAQAHNQLGMALGSTGKLAEATTHFRQALNLKPDYGDAHYNMGIALQSQGDVDGAIRHYKLALKFEPTYAEAHNNLGQVLANRGQYTEAADHFRKAIRINPKLDTARVNLEKVLRVMGKTP